MKKKILVTLLAVALVLSCALITVFAMYDMEKPLAVMKGMAGLDTMPQYADANGDGEVNVLDVIKLMREQKLDGVYLNSITLDDANYSIGQFSQTKTEYTVQLPAGRPAIPQISAQANSGHNVEITQAYIPDGETEGTAYAVVSNGQYSRRYTVKFVRDIENGFVLQYDDRYTLPIAADGYTYSSNNGALTVDENGLMTAKAVTNTPITVTATKDSDTKTFTVDRIEKAHINLFFITGQSNGQGCYDGVTVDGEGELEDPNQIYYNDQLAAVERPGQNGRVYSFDVHPRSENVNFYNDPAFQANVIYDMNDFSRQGHSSPLGKAWYEKTGEKVIFLQSAWSGAPIETWLDPDRYEEAGGYGIATRNFYQTTKAGYNTLVGLLSENYEIIRKANFWCQGETAMTAYYDKATSNYIFGSNAKYDSSKLITDKKYYEYFMRIDKDMREDFGLQYNGIMMTKTKGMVSDTIIIPIVSAYFSLVDNNDGIFVATRKFIEIARQFTDPDKTSEGWNYLGTDDNHYNQIGYNYHGKEAAENAFGYVFKASIEEATGVEIIATNGKDRLTSADTIEVKAGGAYRFGALSVPRYLSEKITWSSSDETVAKVDEFGVVTPLANGKAVITATAESGASQSFNVKAIALKQTRVNYRWDFNDLKATGVSNDLHLSQAASENSENYTIKDGVYSTKSGIDYKYRPDFTFEKPFSIDSQNDWTIEWKYKSAKDTAVTLMGATPKEGETNYINGRIYIYHAREWGKDLYPLNINFEEGNAVMINYGNYRTYNNEMNTWKLTYSKDTKKMTLLFLNTSTEEWETVGSATTGEFRTTFTTLFGRQNYLGAMNLVGEVDYVEVDCIGYESDEYIWNFNDLTSSADKNDLTISPLANQTAANNYTLKDGIYSTTSNTGAYLSRPDFTLEKSFAFDSECDWYVEWKVKMEGVSVLMGQTPSILNDPTDLPGFIYLSYSVNWGTEAKPLYPLSFKTSEGIQYNLNYGDYNGYNTEMNTWKLEYKKDTNKLTLYLLDTAKSSWITVDSVKTGEFTLTITNLLGRVDGQASMNFRGSVDYVKVYTERTK